GGAVAASFAAAGMGTDTCGSIRIPSSHNNLTGLRPTRGLSSRGGVIPLSHTQDVAGPIARSVRDVARLLDATVGTDPDDAVTQLGAGHIPRSYIDGLAAATLKSTRVGVLKELFGDTPDDAEVTSIVNAATARMRAAGAEVVDIAVPGLAELMRSSSVIDAEFKFDLADYLAAHPASPVKSLGDIMSLGLYHVDLDVNFRRRNAMVSRDTEAYRASLAKQKELADAMLAAMDAAHVSFVVYPPIRRKAALIGEPQPGGNNCQLSASTGFPALVVPAGFTPDGLPVGIEMLGRPWSEQDLLSAGLALEQSALQRKAPASAPPLTTSALLLTGATMVMAPVRATGALDQSAVTLTADFTWNASTRALDYHVTMTGDPLDVILLALHRGDAGGNGPIVAPLTRTGARTMNGRVTLRESDRGAVESGTGYIEIYTHARPLGAARVIVKMPPR
ncbi:MAG: amidase family protein, partial [Acidobacteriota bacterium]